MSKDIASSPTNSNEKSVQELSNLNKTIPFFLNNSPDPISPLKSNQKIKKPNTKITVQSIIKSD